MNKCHRSLYSNHYINPVYEVCLVIIQPQHILFHPLLNFKYTLLNTCQAIPAIIVGMIHCHIQLCVICIRMMRQSMPLNDVTNRFGVHAIHLCTHNITLWDSKAKLLIYGYSVFNNYTRDPTSYIYMIYNMRIMIHNGVSKTIVKSNVLLSDRRTLYIHHKMIHMWCKTFHMFHMYHLTGPTIPTYHM